MLRILQHTNLLWQKHSNTNLDDTLKFSFYENQNTQLVGKIVFREMTVDNDLWEFDYSEKVNQYIENNLDEFVNLEYIQVEKQFRNKGYGTKMMKFFLEKIHKPIILYANPYDIFFESQDKRESFKQNILYKFYESFGFKHIDKGYFVKL